MVNWAITWEKPPERSNETREREPTEVNHVASHSSRGLLIVRDKVSAVRHCYVESQWFVWPEVGLKIPNTTLMPRSCPLSLKVFLFTVFLCCLKLFFDGDFFFIHYEKEKKASSFQLRCWAGKVARADLAKSFSFLWIVSLSKRSFLCGEWSAPMLYNRKNDADPVFGAEEIIIEPVTKLWEKKGIQSVL